MKYLYLFFLFFLGTYSNCIANTYDQDSLLFSNRSIEGIAKMIYAYMEDYELTIQKYRESEISAGEKKGMQLYKSKFIDNLESYNKAPYLLDSISNFLSKDENNWSSAGFKLFKALRDNYDTELKSKTYNLEAIFDVGDLTLIYVKKQDKKFNDFAQWEKTLAEILKVNSKPLDFSNQIDSANANIQTAEIPANTANEIVIRNESKGSLFFRIMSYILIFILGCFSAIVYFNFRIKDILEEEYKEYKSQVKANHKKYPPFIFGIIAYLKEKKNNYKSITSIQNTESNDNFRLRNLTEDNKNLADRYSKLEKEYLDFKDQIKNNNVINENVNIEQAGNINRQEKKANILYFSIPEENGSFLEDTASITASVRSYYQIEYFDGERVGKLNYRSGNLDDSALSQMDDILGPVCEIENSLMNNPTKIIVKSHGAVVKEEDSWKIKDKIKIKLI